MSVHWISPYRTDKNIGLAINAAVKRLRITCAQDDWVVLLDQDIMFRQPDTKAHIIEILETTDYGVLGCMTNRLGDTEQRVAGMFNEDSITRHVQVAEELWQEQEKTVIRADTLAAMPLCFRISTWARVGGFNENQLNFDTLFSYRARRCGLKLGLMKGIYVLHLYRWLAADPRNSYKHICK